MFPGEVLHLILNQCELPTLKNFLSVSEEFREIILSTPQLMRKLDIIFFHSISSDKISFLEENGSKVRAMKFDFCPISTTDDIRKILNLTPNLEKLEIEVFASQQIIQENDIELNLEALKTLKIVGSKAFTKAFVYDLRNCRNIEKFSVQVYFEVPVSDVGDFLSYQRNLKEIEVLGNGDNDCGLKTVFTEKFIKADFKLKTLVLRTGLQYNEALSYFLLTQSDCIEVLDVRNHKIDFHYYRVIFKNFHKLKKICFLINSIFNDTRCAELSEYSLQSVTEFETDDYVEDPSALPIVMKVFPNLEVIHSAVSNFPFQVILENLPKLKTIKASFFQLETMLTAKSLSLRELDVRLIPESLMQRFIWEKIAEDCQNIEKLLIKDVGKRRLSKTRNSEIGIILNVLKHFKRLAFVELKSRIDPPQITYDHDNPAELDITQNVLTLEFFLKKKFDGTFSLKCSSYFSQHQAEAIDKIKENFHVTVVEDVD